MTDQRRLVSVVVPTHNEVERIGDIIAAVRAQKGLPPSTGIEIVITDDGSTDGTPRRAEEAGAKVVTSGVGNAANPAAARNRGAAASLGDPIVFLDADCLPAPGWLEALLNAHARGEIVVGGSLDLPRGLSFSARCDYYCGWYNVHPRRRGGYVPNHPPGNLSVRRELFLSTSMFEERQPIAFAHEELGWQAEVQRRGIKIYFEPEALVQHFNRPGFGNLLRRNYRWAYSSVETKNETGAARFGFLYKYPLVPILAAPLLVLGQTGYILTQWTRAKRFEPFLLAPALVAARAAYAAGTVVGGLQWLKMSKRPTSEYRPRWE